MVRRPASPSSSSPVLPRARAGAGLLALGLFLSSCAAGSSGDGEENGGGGTSVAEKSTLEPSAAPFPEIAVVPTSRAKGVDPAEEVSVALDGGTLAKVSLTNETDGSRAAGELSADKTSWRSTEELAAGSEYLLRYTVVQPDGTRTPRWRAFTTAVATQTVVPELNVVDGATYGTGQVVQLSFPVPVTNKAAVEKAVSVKGGGGEKGAFRWYSDTLVRYRPAQEWTPRSKVSLTVDLEGADLAEGYRGGKVAPVSFSVGPKQYARVDNETKTLTAYVDGKEVASYPVTLGNPDWPSTTGKKVIMEQADSYLFKASSLNIDEGDPHWYETFYASNVSRLTQSGEFIHQALPSAMPVLGVANVSHGCVGMPVEGAKFIYDTFRPGDVVEILNTGYPQADPDDGYGDWNIPFKNYADEGWKGNW